MKWIYRCPHCGNWRSAEWANRAAKFLCGGDVSKPYTPPTPADQHDAYVDERKWPPEMESVVTTLKGKKCTVPVCNHDYETLDHRVAWANKGRTSVDNLWPMCIEHNSSKQDTEYRTWLRSVGKA